MTHIQVRTAPDSALLDATRAGDLNAYGELWNRHARAGNTAARNIAPSLDPQDLTSEAFLKIFRALKAGKGPTGAFRPYLYQTLRSLSADWLKERDPILTSTNEPLDAVADLDTPLPWDDSTLDSDTAVRAFASLDERWKTVLWYTEVEQLPPREVATLMGTSPNSVSKLAARAREGLRFAWVDAHLAEKTYAPECERPLQLLQKLQRGRISAKATAELQSHLATCETCPKAAAELDSARRRMVPALLLLIFGSGVSASFLTMASGAAPASAAAVGGSALGLGSMPDFAQLAYAPSAAGAGGLTAGATGAAGSTHAGSSGLQGLLAWLKSPVGGATAGVTTVAIAAGAIAAGIALQPNIPAELTSAPNSGSQTEVTDASTPGAPPHTSALQPSETKDAADLTDPPPQGEANSPVTLTDPPTTARDEHPDAGAAAKADANANANAVGHANAGGQATANGSSTANSNGDSNAGQPGSNSTGNSTGNASGNHNANHNGTSNANGGSDPGDGFDHTLQPNYLCYFEQDGPGFINIAGVASSPGFIKVRVTQPPSTVPVELIVAFGVTTATDAQNWWFTESLTPLDKWPGLLPGEIRDTTVEVQLITYDHRKSPWHTVVLPDSPPPITTCGLATASMPDSAPVIPEPPIPLP